MTEIVLTKAMLDSWVEEEKLSPNQADMLWKDIETHQPDKSYRPSHEFMLTVLCLASMGLSFYVIAALFLG